MQHAVPTVMAAVELIGHGGFEQLKYRDDVPTPAPAVDQVLIRVAAAGVNNTDINTRVGWYSKMVSASTDVGGADGFADVGDDGAWSEPLQFPRIQGADCCGHVVAVGDGIEEARIGQRVLVRPMHEPAGAGPFECITFGSELDGAFAQYAVVAAHHAYPIDCDWTDVELASIPCAWSTAEGLLHRVDLGAERVLITGASGGVGSAAVQLAKRRGAHVTAVAGASKANAVRDLGADAVVDRSASVSQAVGSESVDVVIDLVAGPMFAELIDVLRVGGRYAVSGAIGGPIVDLDVRDLYLKDLSFFGCTYQEPVVFQNLINYIERGEVRAAVAATFPLDQIVAAQQRFLAKDFVGKLVLVPPAD